MGPNSAAGSFQRFVCSRILYRSARLLHCIASLSSTSLNEQRTKKVLLMMSFNATASHSLAFGCNMRALTIALLHQQYRDPFKALGVFIMWGKKVKFHLALFKVGSLCTRYSIERNHAGCMCTWDNAYHWVAFGRRTSWGRLAACNRLRQLVPSINFYFAGVGIYPFPESYNFPHVTLFVRRPLENVTAWFYCRRKSYGVL